MHVSASGSDFKLAHVGVASEHLLSFSPPVAEGFVPLDGSEIWEQCLGTATTVAATRNSWIGDGHDSQS